MCASQDPHAQPARPLASLADWHPRCYQRAAAFVTDPENRLLVLEHIDGDAGTQVPAGGIHVGESPEDAVLRELAEESGVTAAVIVRKLGEAWNRSEPGNVPAGLEEQIHHVYHLRLPDMPALEVWDWEERSGGDTVEHRFSFRWAALEAAEQELWPAQAMWINAVRLSALHSG